MAAQGVSSKGVPGENRTGVGGASNTGGAGAARTVSGASGAGRGAGAGANTSAREAIRASQYDDDFVLLYRFVCPIRAAEAGTDLHRRNADCECAADLERHDIDCHTVVNAAGVECVEPDLDGEKRAHVSFFAVDPASLPSNKFGKVVKAHRRVMARYRNSDDGVACRTWKAYADTHPVAHDCTDACTARGHLPIGIQSIEADGGAAPYRFLHYAAYIADGNQPVARINDVAMGRDDSGEHWSDCVLALDSSRWQLYDAEGDDDDERHVQRAAWKQHHGWPVCYALQAAMLSYGVPQLRDMCVERELRAATYEDMVHASLYLAVFRAWPSVALAEWATVDGGAALRLVALGVRVVHAALEAGVAPLDAISVTTGSGLDALAVHARLKLGVRWPLLTWGESDLEEAVESSTW